MKDCRDIDHLLPAYLDNELSAEEKKLVDGHLSACHRCRAALADLKKTMGLLQGMQEVEPPPWFARKVMSQVREEAEKKKGIIARLFYPLHIKVPVQALATVLIAVLAFHVYKTSEPDVRRMDQLPAPAVELKKEQAPAASPQKMEAREERREAKTPPVARLEEKKRGSLFAPVPREERKGAKALDEAVGDLSAAARQRAPEPTRPPEGIGNAAPAPEAVGSAARASKAEEQAPGSRMYKRSEEREALTAEAGRRQKTTFEDREPSAKKDMSYAPSAAPQAMAKSKTAAGYQLYLVIRVSDVSSAADEAEGILRRYGVSATARQLGERRRLLTAEIKGQHLKDAVDRLKAVGRLRIIGAMPGASETPVPLRIEIVGGS